MKGNQLRIGTAVPILIAPRASTHSVPADCKGERSRRAYSIAARRQRPGPSASDTFTWELSSDRVPQTSPEGPTPFERGGREPGNMGPTIPVSDPVPPTITNFKPKEHST
jgi:hypothetical protein